MVLQYTGSPVWVEHGDDCERSTIDVDVQYIIDVGVIFNFKNNDDLIF